MTPAEWSQIKEVLSGALDCPPEQRTAYLERACAGDPERRRRVEELINADSQTWELMEGPALAASTITADLHYPVRGERIGAYEILQEIGHGGMGVVYLARRADEQYQKRVAIKLARIGMAGDWVERRFRSERQIVAGLDHPNIARLLDGGATADGRAYLVMEYVEGEALGQWCEKRKLETRQRLEIFLEVCAAVAYAHQHLVVHRDLKPANILVTPEGSVKLLDFGIAKLIEPEQSGESAERTGTLFRLLTPDYASPEQIRGDPVSTASDVYALGVVLYELLTGAKPYRTADCSPAELILTVCEKEPPKPSSIASPPRSHQLAGDLDTIIVTALRKEPARRYPSVEALADDIRRHLAGLPVLARTDTFGYRAGKFVRRHRTAVAASVFVVLALAGGLIATMAEARRARAAEARAERRFNDVRKLANSFLFEVHDAIANLPGATPARALLVKRALEYLDDLEREKGSDPGLRRELATAYMKVGDVLGRSGSPNLGDSQGALASYRKALRLRQELVGADPHNRELALELAQSYESVGEHFEALGILEELARTVPGDLAVQKALQVSYHGIAVGFNDRKDFEKVLVYRQKQMAVAEAVFKAAPSDRGASRSLAIAYKYMGGAMESLQRPAEGVSYYKKAAALDEERCVSEPAGSPARLDLSYDYGGIGNCLASLGDLSEGLRFYRQALAIRKAVAEADPKNVDAQAAVARAERKIGWILGKGGDFGGALASHESALELRRDLAQKDPANEVSAYNVSESLNDIAEIQIAVAATPGTSEAGRRNHWTEARTAYRGSLDILHGLQGQGKLEGIIEKDVERIESEIARCDEALKR